MMKRTNFERQDKRLARNRLADTLLYGPIHALLPLAHFFARQWSAFF
jgi:hypothetical protein